MTQIQRQKTKIVFLGDENVGKTSIIARYMYDHFEDMHHPTIGIDFFSKSLVSDDLITRLQIWDTAGQERFRSLIPGYIRDVSIAFIVYDITNKKSFDNVSYWIESIQKERQSSVRGNSNSNEEFIIFLIGNKNDLSEDWTDNNNNNNNINNSNNNNKEEKEESDDNKNNKKKNKIVKNLRQVTEKEGLEKAKKFGIEFIETSAKTGINIDKAFLTAVNCWVKKQHDIMDDKLENMSIKTKDNTKNVDLEKVMENAPQQEKSTFANWCCFQWMKLI